MFYEMIGWNWLWKFLMMMICGFVMYSYRDIKCNFLNFFLKNSLLNHTLTWICHRCTWVPNPEPPSHLSPHITSLGHPSAPAPSNLFYTWNYWSGIFRMSILMGLSDSFLMIWLGSQLRGKVSHNDCPWLSVIQVGL